MSSDSRPAQRRTAALARTANESATQILLGDEPSSDHAEHAHDDDETWPDRLSEPSNEPLAESYGLSGEAAELSRRAATRPGLLHEALWRASELGTQVHRSVSTGWEALDRELPGGGWPLQSITEVLSPQPSVLEWRLLSNTLRQVKDGQVIVIGPPKRPHLPGLLQCGLDQRRLVWIQADGPAERLWVTEQVIRANAAGAVLAWLPQARQDQLRRLQVSAQACDCPIFLMRPQTARHEASPAPLRVHATFSVDWELQVHVFKRRGPVHETPLVLPSVPTGLTRLLTPRLLRPSSLISIAGSDTRRVHDEATTDAVGSASTLSAGQQRQRTAHASH